MQTWNDTDAAKVADLAAAIDAAGWQGAPLVADGEMLLTGSHRYDAAVRVLGWTANDVPTVDVREVFADAGADYDAMLAKQMDSGLSWEVAVPLLLAELPAAVVAEYGFDSF